MHCRNWGILFLLSFFQPGAYVNQYISNSTQYFIYDQGAKLTHTSLRQIPD